MRDVLDFGSHSDAEATAEAAAGGEATSTRLAASFRDPSGYVFRRGGRIYRAIDDRAAEAIRGLEGRGVLGRWIDAGRVVATRFVDAGDESEALARENPGF